MPKSINDRLLSKTVAHHIGLQRLAAGSIQTITSRLRDNDAEIFDVIRRRANGDGLITPGVVEGLLGTVRNINARVYRDIGTGLRGDLNDLAEYEVEHGGDMIVALLPFDWDVVKPKRKFVRAIIDEEPMHGGLLNEWIEGMAFGRFQRLRSAIRTGISIGENTDQIVRRIRGRRANNYRDGVLDISTRSANRVVSTFYNHVANRAKLTLFDNNKDIIQFVVWTAVLDDVTCNQCAALDGEQYSLEDAAVIEESAGGPPLHPNCRCVLSPVIGTLDDFDIDPSEVTPAMRQLVDGSKPEKLTYQQWLKDQGKETQDDILGREKAMMFRRGMSVKKFVDNSGRRLTLHELRRIEAREARPKQGRVPFMASTVKRKNYGWKPDLPDQRDFLYAVEEKKDIALPVRMSLRDRMPDVFNQGDLGSCVANALIAAKMYADGAKTPMLSRLDLYYKARFIEDTVNEDSGVEIRDAIKAMAKWGVATEATWPYKVRSFRKQPSQAAAAEDDQYRIKKYMRLKSHDDFLRCLADEYPFVGGFSVYENFEDNFIYDTGIMVMPTVDQNLIGGHAVLFTGYDSDFHNNPVFRQSGLQTSQVPSLMYEARNSFGADWGDEGYFWMPSPYVEDRELSDDFWTIRA